MTTKLLSRLSASLVALLSPSLALAATVVGGVSGSGGFLGISWGSGGAVCANNLCSIAQTILYTINNVLVPLLFGIAFLVFLYGVFKKYIWSRGDETEVEKGHYLILWGIIGFVVMISLWGLVNVVANTFGLAGYSAPPPPTSY